LLPLVIAAEYGGGLIVVTGFAARWAAIALAGFCLLTALFFHRDSGDAEVINFQKSCMTCHALASFNRYGNANGALTDNAIGDVDQAGLRDYLLDGFVWGAAKAK
jgi:uncharacterized membrane protein YphA (DoxX/SURF4 family)